jgi:DNA end-binding protein Ku
MAVKLIDQLTEPWEPEQYRDTYIDTLREIIQQKAEGKELAPLQEEEVPTDVTDLFAKLRESLEQAQKDRG